jgi:hypothetical protein
VGAVLSRRAPYENDTRWTWFQLQIMEILALQEQERPYDAALRCYLSLEEIYEYVRSHGAKVPAYLRSRTPTT